jgi:hypothetical protein
MAKAMSVKSYLLKRPQAKTLEVMGATGAKKTTVYKIRYMMKKEGLFADGAASSSHPKRLGRPPKTIDFSALRQQVQMPLFEAKPDNVNHPVHYKVGGVETIDFIEAKKLNYNLGNVVKYITRADHKGNRKEDLEKARWYLDREIKSIS